MLPSESVKNNFAIHQLMTSDLTCNRKYLVSSFLLGGGYIYFKYSCRCWKI